MKSKLMAGMRLSTFTDRQVPLRLNHQISREYREHLPPRLPILG
jgi:hypothetical protein